METREDRLKAFGEKMERMKQEARQLRVAPREKDRHEIYVDEWYERAKVKPGPITWAAMRCAMLYEAKSHYLPEDRGPEPDWDPRYEPRACEQCGDVVFKMGWCAKHYRMLYRGRPLSDSPEPTTHRPGRPALRRAADNSLYTSIRISRELLAAITAIKGEHPRWLVAETLLREVLGLPPHPDAA